MVQQIINLIIAFNMDYMDRNIRRGLKVYVRLETSLLERSSTIAMQKRFDF